MNIKLIILDVDGTMTDGNVYYGDGDVEIKAFSVKDGAILKPLPKIGIHTIFLTGRECAAVLRRATDLGATAIQNISDKAAKLYEICDERGIDPEMCAYIGDDLNDYAAMKLCGFKACPADAVDEIKAISDFISSKNGGCGAVRDICENILMSMGRWEDLLDAYNVQK